MAKKATEEVKVVEEVKATKTTKAAAKKDTTKKETVKKETAKKETAKKAPVKKEATVDVFVQFAGNQVSTASVEERVKAAYVAEGHRASAIKNLKIYIKPEENAAYYVINEDNVGRVDLFA